jgi:CheY-like chemotaxis protein/HPt (histidine-containing phosphotransfer) domain-containing protein
MASFPSTKLTPSQRARIARRKSRVRSDARFLADLQHSVNTQMNGIIGVLEMMQHTALSADQRDMLGVAQNNAENLLSDVGRLLQSNAGMEIDDALCVQDALAGMRMLLLDADTDNHTRIAAALQQRGARIDCFALPGDALAALANAVTAGDPYRIVLLDQHLPGLSGETLGMAIGGDPMYRDALIVLISDAHASHDASRLAQAGFSAWLPKPLSLPLLFDTLAMLCGCIAKKDAPRFVNAGVRLAGSQALGMLPYADRRILVVDDNRVNLQVAERMLARLGCHVDTAEGGAQALALAAERRYDLILMDCRMPAPDGYQTTALLRAAENSQTHLPIIGWSAGSSRNERDTCLAIGMDDFIAKPMRIQQLNELLARWLHAPADSNAADQDTTQQDDELDVTQQMFGEDFAGLAQLFLADSPQRIASLRSAVMAGDAAAVAKLAHTLCGSTAAIGASALAAMCRELEVRAKNNTLDEAAARIEAIAGEYARIEGRLHAML